MNLVDCIVTDVLGAPYTSYDKWFVDVFFTSYGQPGVTQLMFDTKEEADSVSIGYKFLD